MIELIQLIAEIKAIHQNSEITISSTDFFLVNRRNFDLKHSMDAEMSLEAIRNKRFKRFGV